MQYCTVAWFLLKLLKGDTKALEILENVKNTKDRLMVPIVSYSEFIKKLWQGGINEKKIDEFLETVDSSKNIIISSPTREIAREAAKVSLSYSLSLLDAFIAATSKISKCDLLLTADSDFRPLIKNKYVKVKSW